MAARISALREQVRSAMWDEVDRVGMRAFRASVIVSDFAGCGAGRSTISGWIAEDLRSGTPERILGRKLAHLGLVPANLDDADGHLDRLRECIGAAADVMRAARAEEGAVRRPRTLLAAAEQLRLAVDSAVRVASDGATARAVAAFVVDVAEQVRMASPEVARQVHRRLREVARAAA